MPQPPDPHADGATPGPFSALLGFRYLGVDDHEAVVEADPGPEHCNGGGIVHGGRVGSTEAEITQGGVVVARAAGTHAVLAPPSAEQEASR